jgi:hypothetical protein
MAKREGKAALVAAQVVSLVANFIATLKQAANGLAEEAQQGFLLVLIFIV